MIALDALAVVAVVAAVVVATPSAARSDDQHIVLEGELLRPKGTLAVPAPPGLQASVRIRTPGDDDDEFAPRLERARALAREDSASSAVVDAYAALLCVDGRLSPCTVRDPREPLLARALHELAWILDAVHQRDDEARALYTLLLRHRPHSDAAAHAHLALGEAAFAGASLSSARAHYQRVLQLDEASLHSYARYKLAWVSFNEASFEAAFALFARVAASDAAKLLGREAARDAVRAFAHYGEPAEAAAAFAPFQTLDSGPGRVTALLEKLAPLYLEQGKAAHAIAIVDVIEARPDASLARRCERQMTRLRAHAMLAAPRELVVKETRALLAHGETCADDADPWTAEAARAWRREARATKDARSAAAADAMCAMRAQQRRWAVIDACAPL